jgi:DNA-binding transcriptional regulator GbsR (MarR family)
MNDSHDLVTRYIAAAGDLTQTLGFGRNIGQIYARIYFSPAPQALDDLTESLGISKGSASMSVRQLEQWGALKRVWIKGTRKDYYEADDAFGRIIRKALIDMVGRTTESADTLLEESDTWLKEKTAPSRKTPPDENLLFLRDRVDRIKRFRRRAQGLWNSPVIRVLLK